MDRLKFAEITLPCFFVFSFCFNEVSFYISCCEHFSFNFYLLDRCRSREVFSDSSCWAVRHVRFRNIIDTVVAVWREEFRDYSLFKMSIVGKLCFVIKCCTTVFLYPVLIDINAVVTLMDDWGMVFYIYHLNWVEWLARLLRGCHSYDTTVKF